MGDGIYWTINEIGGVRRLYTLDEVLEEFGLTHDDLVVFVDDEDDED